MRLVAKDVLAFESRLQLAADGVELGDRGLHDHVDGRRGRCGRRGGLLDRYRVVAAAVPLALELRAQPGAESALGFGRGQWNTVMMLSIAGPRMTMNIDGKMKNTVGSNILIG